MPSAPPEAKASRSRLAAAGMKYAAAIAAKQPEVEISEYKIDAFIPVSVAERLMERYAEQ